MRNNWYTIVYSIQYDIVILADTFTETQFVLECQYAALTNANPWDEYEVLSTPS